jgi:hypothetical protein
MQMQQQQAAVAQQIQQAAAAFQQQATAFQYPMNGMHPFSMLPGMQPSFLPGMFHGMQANPNPFSSFFNQPNANSISMNSAMPASTAENFAAFLQSMMAAGVNPSATAPTNPDPTTQDPSY